MNVEIWVICPLPFLLSYAMLLLWKASNRKRDIYAKHAAFHREKPKNWRTVRSWAQWEYTRHGRAGRVACVCGVRNPQYAFARPRDTCAGYDPPRLDGVGQRGPAGGLSSQRALRSRLSGGTLSWGGSLPAYRCPRGGERVGRDVYAAAYAILDAPPG